MVVVKEPGSHAADTIMDLFPQSYLIFLLRDGRDVVDSWLDAYRDGAGPPRRARILDDTGRPALIRWQSSVWLHRTEVVQQTYARTAPGRRVLIRYEEMDDLTSALARIAEMVGIDPGRRELERIAAANAFSRIPESRKGTGREIRRAKPGGWASHMSREEILGCTRSSPRSSTSSAICGRGHPEPAGGPAFARGWFAARAAAGGAPVPGLVV